MVVVFVTFKKYWSSIGIVKQFVKAYQCSDECLQLTIFTLSVHELYNHCDNSVGFSSLRVWTYSVGSNTMNIEDEIGQPMKYPCCGLCM